jgi:type VI protein secretion system component Hcp
MSQQRSDEKPAPAAKPDAKSHQPVLTELSPTELENVSGGNKVQMSDIVIVKPVDKASPGL